MKTVTMPIKNKKIEVVFPQICIYCGKPSKTELGIRKDIFSAKIPYCDQHAKESSRNDLILTFMALPFALPGVIVIIVLGEQGWGLLGFVIGAAIAALLSLPIYFGAKTILPKIFKSLDSLPHQNGENALGIDVTIIGSATDRPTVTFGFFNDDFADKFAELNHQQASTESWQALLK